MDPPPRPTSAPPHRSRRQAARARFRSRLAQAAPDRVSLARPTQEPPSRVPPPTSPRRATASPILRRNLPQRVSVSSQTSAAAPSPCASSRLRSAPSASNSWSATGQLLPTSRPPPPRHGSCLRRTSACCANVSNPKVSPSSASRCTAAAERNPRRPWPRKAGAMRARTARPPGPTAGIAASAAERGRTPRVVRAAGAAMASPAEVASARMRSDRTRRADSRLPFPA